MTEMRQATTATEPLTRRALLGRAAVAGAALAAEGSLLTPRTATAVARRRRRQIALPSPHQVRADFTRMVEFGPRLTGSDNHNRYIAWLEQEFVAAGLELRPCDVYKTNRWLAGQADLTVLQGAGGGRVKIGTYHPPSQET